MPVELKVEPVTNGERRPWARLSEPGGGWSGSVDALPMAPLDEGRDVLYGEPAFVLGLGRQGPALNVGKLDNALWLPRRVIVHADRKALSQASFRRPQDAPATVTLAEMPEPRRIVSGATYHLTTQHRGYGHLLLEGISQAWALDMVQADRVLVNKRFSHIAKALLAPLTTLPVMEVTRPTEFETLYVASQSYRLDGAISSRFVEICQRIRDFYAPEAKPEHVLYVSRRFSSKRRLRQEGEIEDRLASLGAKVLYPEREGLAEQIAAFAGARAVIGPVGSALYNCAFSHPGTERIILAPDWFYTRNDVLLSAFTLKAPKYLFGTSDGRSRIEGMSADWDLPAEGTIDAIRDVTGL